MYFSFTRFTTILVILLINLSDSAFAGKTRNCRDCTCTVNFGGVFKTDKENLDAFMRTACKKITGGGGWYFRTGLTEVKGQVGTKVWQAEVEFYRLCGKTSFVNSKDIAINHYQEGGSNVVLNCLGCNSHVKCNGGSDCHHSGLMG